MVEPLYSTVALPLTDAVNVSPMSASLTVRVPAMGAASWAWTAPAEILSISNALVDPVPRTTLSNEASPKNSTYPFDEKEPRLPLAKSGLTSFPVKDATSVVPL